MDGILNLLYGILAPIIEALPKGNLPEGVFASINGFAGYLYSIDAIVPVAGPFVFMVGVIVATIPALIAYRVGVFIFDKIRGA